MHCRNPLCLAVQLTCLGESKPQPDAKPHKGHFFNSICLDRNNIFNSSCLNGKISHLFWNVYRNRSFCVSAEGSCLVGSFCLFLLLLSHVSTVCLTRDSIFGLPNAGPFFLTWSIASSISFCRWLLQQFAILRALAPLLSQALLTQEWLELLLWGALQKSIDILTLLSFGCSGTTEFWWWCFSLSWFQWKC